MDPNTLYLVPDPEMCPNFEKNVKNDFVNIFVFDKNIFFAEYGSNLLGTRKKLG